MSYLAGDGKSPCSVKYYCKLPNVYVAIVFLIYLLVGEG